MEWCQLYCANLSFLSLWIFGNSLQCFGVSDFVHGVWITCMWWQCCLLYTDRQQMCQWYGDQTERTYCPTWMAKQQRHQTSTKVHHLKYRCRDLLKVNLKTLDHECSSSLWKLWWDCDAIPWVAFYFPIPIFTADNSSFLCISVNVN